MIRVVNLGLLAVLQDINQDRVQDVIVCASQRYCTVVYGRTVWPERITATNVSSREGYRITADRSWIAVMGVAVASVRDLNGDGYEDVAISTLTISFQSVVFVVFGRPARQQTTISLSDVSNGVNGFRLYGSEKAYTGFSLTGLGDLNKDGYDDLALGKISQEVVTSHSTLLVFGNATRYCLDQDWSSSSNKKPKTLAMTEVTGAGFLVMGVGDLNQDNIPDLLIVDNPQFIRQERTQTISLPRIVASPPTAAPTSQPSNQPSSQPTTVPSLQPTHHSLTRSPSYLQTSLPTVSPSLSLAPSTAKPSRSPSYRPSILKPTPLPFKTLAPTPRPSRRPTPAPTTTNPTTSPTVSSIVTGSSQTLPPTTLSDNIIKITHPGIYTTTSNSNSNNGSRTIFQIQSIGRIFLTGGTSSSSSNVYQCIPVGNQSTMTQVFIANYQETKDWMDLSAFTSLHHLTDLSFRDRPLTLLPARNYQIVLTSFTERFVNPEKLQFNFSSTASSATTSTTSDTTTTNSASIASFSQAFSDPSVVIAMTMLFVCVICSCSGACRSGSVSNTSSHGMKKRKESDPPDDFPELAEEEAQPLQHPPQPRAEEELMHESLPSHSLLSDDIENNHNNMNTSINTPDSSHCESTHHNHHHHHHLATLPQTRSSSTSSRHNSTNNSSSGRRSNHQTASQQSSHSHRTSRSHSSSARSSGYSSRSSISDVSFAFLPNDTSSTHSHRDPFLEPDSNQRSNPDPTNSKGNHNTPIAASLPAPLPVATTTTVTRRQALLPYDIELGYLRYLQLIKREDHGEADDESNNSNHSYHLSELSSSSSDSHNNSEKD